MHLAMLKIFVVIVVLLAGALAAAVIFGGPRSPLPAATNPWALIPSRGEDHPLL